MPNDILFIGAVVINLLLILGSFQFGRAGLILAITTNLILVSTFASKLISVFGLLSNIGNIFYGSLFLGTNLLIERYGTRAAYSAVWLAFCGNTLFIVMGQFGLRFAGDATSTSTNEAITTLFSNTPRLALASILAYIIVQHFNVWFYSSLKKYTGEGWLWLRHTASLSLSQLFDSIIFFSVAFYGIVSTGTLLGVMVTGFLLKVCIGFASIPLMYVAQHMSAEESNDD